MQFKGREEELITALSSKFGMPVPDLPQIIAAREAHGAPSTELYNLAQQYSYHTLMSSPTASMNDQTVISVHRHTNKRTFLAKAFSNIRLVDAVDGPIPCRSEIGKSHI